MAVRIFMCHIREEKELAQIFKRNIEQDFDGAVEVFIDDDNIPAGEEWRNVIRKGLEDAKLQLILCSQNSIRRHWINFESGAAWLQGVDVIPICHSKLQPTELPSTLEQLRAVIANSEAGLKLLYDKISPDGKNPREDFRSFTKEIEAFESGYASQITETYSGKVLKNRIRSTLIGTIFAISLLFFSGLFFDWYDVNSGGYNEQVDARLEQQKDSISLLIDRIAILEERANYKLDILLVDSYVPCNVYAYDKNDNRKTNSDKIRTTMKESKELRDMSFSTIRVGPLDDITDEVEAINPKLIVMHYSAFRQNDTSKGNLVARDRFRRQLNKLLDITESKFLIYSRRDKDLKEALSKPFNIKIEGSDPRPAVSDSTFTRMDFIKITRAPGYCGEKKNEDDKYPKYIDHICHRDLADEFEEKMIGLLGVTQ